MDVSFTLDLPPVPGCFTKLLAGENAETSPLPSQPWREVERLRELKDIMLQALAKESVPETPVIVNGKGEVSGDDVDEISDGEEGDHAEGGESSPFTRLNSALCRLKREMVNLRHMDMSLFCQLLSLNEAIQDFKMTVNDRYSEYTGSEYTCSEYGGSEYSFGGMGSRVGSFSSLNEESGWLHDFRTEDPNSPLSPEESGGSTQNVDVDITTSTSSLLQQITALTERAEADFSV